MSDVQTMQHNQERPTPDIPTNPVDVETQETVTEAGENEPAEPARRRRKFRPDEVALANQFKNLAEMGTPIPFSSLKREMKLTVLPAKRSRLLDRGVLEVEYDEETGSIQNVLVNKEMWEAYEWELDQPIPVKQPSGLAPGEVRQRKPRTILSDPKYKIKRLRDTNPRREKSHGWYNWEECYEDGMSIPEYLSNMNYNRTIVTDRGTYFNGPSTLFLDQDIKAKYLGVYDSSKDFFLPDGKPNPDIWLKWEDIDSPGASDAEEPEPDLGLDDTDSANEANPATLTQGSQTEGIPAETA